MTSPVIKNQAGFDSTGHVYALNLMYDSANDQWVAASGASAAQVQGPAADGAAAVGNPVQIGGVDGSGNVQAVATDTSGNQIVVGNVASGVADAGAPVKVGGLANNGTPSPVSAGQRVDMWASLNGAPVVAGISVTGTDAITNTIVALPTNGGAVIRPLLVAPATFNGSTWDRQVKPNLTGRLLGTAANTNSTNVKASAGNLHKILVNVAVAGKFLKVYNKATAPTVGTDTPVLTIPLPTAGLVQIDLGTNGEYFSAGIGFGVTGLIADADTTAVAANDLTGINFIYS